MNNEKLCEYLSDKGVLLFDNIDLFFQVYSSNNNKQFKNEPEKLKESLFLYLEKTTKDDNLLRLMSSQIIESYYNSQAVTKYKTMKNLINILQAKLLLNYTNFIANIFRYIMNKNKGTKSLNLNESNKEEIKRKNSNDNNISNPQEQNISEKQSKPKKKKSKPKKKPQMQKVTNQYKNNYYICAQLTQYETVFFFDCTVAIDKDNKFILEETYREDISDLNYNKVKEELDVVKVIEYAKNSNLVDAHLVRANYVKKIEVEK